MLFNSPIFIFAFLPLVFLGYFFLNTKRLLLGAKVWLLVASLFFYSYWNPLYLPLILLSIGVNYSIGLALGFLGKECKESDRYARWRLPVLWIGIVFNLALLCYFKYSDFFIENINVFLENKIEILNIVLPLAISFFTFQQISYIVDSYHRKTQEYNFLNYALFVTFFPQLIAGPIVHHKQMMPQFSSKWNLVKKYKNIAVGFFIFSLGLCKKVVIADAFAPWVDYGFDEAPSLGFYEAWITSLSYTFQLYFDFSGYSDMAIGLALLFNIYLPVNFNSPYKAKNIQKVWQCWHITLVQFLRNYIYIPLGKGRSRGYRNSINIIIVFLIAGFWHGAGWLFIIWGGMHGAALITNRAWKRLGIKIWGWISWFLTFNFINFSLVFFRANSFSDVKKILGGMVDFGGATGLSINDIRTENLAWGGFIIDTLNEYLPTFIFVNPFACFMILFAFVLIWFPNSLELGGYIKGKGISTTLFGQLFASLIFVISCYIMLSSTSSVFLYFNF